MSTIKDEEIKLIESDYLELKRKNPQIKQEHEPKIQNVVSTVHLKITKDGEENKEQKLELEKIASKISNSEYKKSRFPALIHRISDPKSTALIFEAGKMVITGTKGIKEAEEAAQKIMKNLEKASKLKIKLIKIETSNIVANSQLSYQVNLMSIYDDKELKQSITYNRNDFPGLIYKMVKPRLAALIFYSGKIVFTGAKNEYEIKQAYCQLFHLLKERKHTKQPDKIENQL